MTQFVFFFCTENLTEIIQKVSFENLEKNYTNHLKQRGSSSKNVVCEFRKNKTKNNANKGIREYIELYLQNINNK